jgi:hypothetical protein
VSAERDLELRYRKRPQLSRVARSISMTSSLSKVDDKLDLRRRVEHHGERIAGNAAGGVHQAPDLVADGEIAIGQADRRVRWRGGRGERHGQGQFARRGGRFDRNGISLPETRVTMPLAAMS